MFLNCPNLRVLIRISLGLFVLGYSLILHGQTATVRWGTHEGISSPLWEADWGTGPGYTDGNPAGVQTLKDLSGNLVNSSGGPGTGSWSKGDLVELGFFASALGSDNAAGGTSGNADTPSTNLFQGTWIPLTGLTHIGQDWGTRSSFDGSAFEMKQTVDAGEFAFSSAFTKIGDNWQSYVKHNDDADNTYEIITTSGGNSDQPSNLADSSAILTTSTKLGIRFYDAASVSNGATKYNTVMNTNWTWPGIAATEEMYLHDISNPDDLDSNLKFEFDNTSYGDGNSDFTAKVDGSSVSDHGTAGDLNTDDFVTTITYWTGLSALDISANNKDTVLSGVTGSSTITGGSDNILTMNVNGVGVSTNAYSFDGDIVDNGANNGGIRVVKTGAGSQTLTGNLALDDDTDSYLSVYEGTLALDTASGKTHTVEYLTGESGATLELKDGDSDLITLGFAHTTSAKDFEGTLLLSDNIAHTVKVSTGTAAADYGKEQILSGSLSTSGTDTLVKDGVGKLRLTGDSSSNYDNALTVNHGTLIIGDGSDGGAALHSSTTVSLETGKLEIAASENISNTIAGSTTSSKKSMVGGKGTLSTGGAGVAIGSGSGEIDVISPGHGVSSSLTNTTSQVQASVGNGSDSIGTFTVTNLNLNDGGVYDWEISNFAGSAGSGWDVLAYSDLDFEGNQAFDINIFSLASDGSSGANSGDTFAAKSGASGFKFLDGGSHGAINWGSFTNPGNGGGTLASGYFDINQQGWSHYNHHYGSWGVYYDGAGDFYLEYSAVPEPSTYIMVTSLLMVPGYNFVRRYRKKKSAEENEIPENLS